MLLPHSHAWTRLQKGLIIGTSIILIALTCIGICAFERFHGSPSDSVLIGTWATTFPNCMDNCATWVRFNSDHTAIWFSRSGDGIGFTEDFRTPWVGLGPYIFMRAEGKRLVWQIIEIGPDELRLRAAKTDYIFKRVSLDLPQASNHPMERTAGSHGKEELGFMKDEIAATRSPTSRRSSCSR